MCTAVPLLDHSLRSARFPPAWRASNGIVASASEFLLLEASPVQANNGRVPSSSGALVGASAEHAPLAGSDIARFRRLPARLPHARCEVDGWAAEQGILECPCHNSRYDPRNGAAIVEGPTTRVPAALPLGITDGKLTVAQLFIGRVGIAPAAGTKRRATMSAPGRGQRSCNDRTGMAESTRKRTPRSNRAWIVRPAASPHVHCGRR
jgi:hypothetical protein